MEFGHHGTRPRLIKVEKLMIVQEIRILSPVNVFKV